MLAWNTPRQGEKDVMKASVRMFSLCVIAVALNAMCAPLAAAQAARVEVAGGYALLRDENVPGSFPIGWFVSGGGNPALGTFRKEWFGVIGEVSGNHKMVSPLGFDIHLSVYSFMGGAKFAAPKWRAMAPFGQFLIGAHRSEVNTALAIQRSATRFAYEPGGGVDVSLASHYAVRVGVNGRFIRSPDQPDRVDNTALIVRSPGVTSKEFQLIAGIVFRK
jgi:hypothetical protein